MARVTVEDCIDKIPNRFELVVLASQRAIDISSGAPLTLAPDNDKNPVIALREIAAGNLDIEQLRKARIAKFQKDYKGCIEDNAPHENVHVEVNRDNLFEDYSDSIEDESNFSIEESGFEVDLDFDDNIEIKD